MRAADRRSDSAKIHNLPTARRREGGGGGEGVVFLNSITGSKCLIPNIDTGNRPQEKVKKKTGGNPPLPSSKSIGCSEREIHATG